MALPIEPNTDALFDLIELPPNGPVSLAVAIPSAKLRALVGFPRAALPESGRIASGRGLTAPGCRRSALGEAVELVSCCDWGDRQFVRAAEAEIGPAALSPDVLNGFTKKQLDSREEWNRVHADFDWRPASYDRNTCIDWIPVEDAFGGPRRFAPADFVMIGRREPSEETAVAIGDSNGCAAGENAAAAKTAAVLEAMERDATSRWWYGCRRRPPINLETILDGDDLRKWLTTRFRRTWLFDITTDLGIPVMAAVSATPDGRDVALGFAARLDGSEAAYAALTEMLQMEFSLETARALGKQMRSWAIWRHAVQMTTPPLDGALTLEPGRVWWFATPSRISEALELCARNDIDLWFVDMTRAEI